MGTITTYTSLAGYYDGSLIDYKAVNSTLKSQVVTNIVNWFNETGYEYTYTYLNTTEVIENVICVTYKVVYDTGGPYSPI